MFRIFNVGLLTSLNFEIQGLTVKVSYSVYKKEKETIKDGFVQAKLDVKA